MQVADEEDTTEGGLLMAGSSKEKPTLGTVTTHNSCLLALLRLAVQHLVCRLKHYAFLVRAPVSTIGEITLLCLCTCCGSWHQHAVGLHV